MLKKLDKIDWKSLTHAYGTATDVPCQLRSLLSDDPHLRGEAISDLFSNIYHQGSLYPATRAAVPFLYELLLSDEVEDREQIADLIASIALQACYEKRAKPIRAACSKHLPSLVPYLKEKVPDIRSNVAEALSEYPEHTASVLPALKAAAKSEKNKLLREALKECVERLLNKGS